MSDTDALEAKRLEVLLKVHEELVDQMISGGSWRQNLTYIYVVIKLGLISTTAILVSIESYLTALLCFSGVVISLVWYHLLRRNDVYSLTRANKAIQIEKELQKKGFPLDTLTSTSELIQQGQFLDRNGKTKSLSWSQKHSLTKIIRNGTVIMALVWLGATLFLLLPLLSVLSSNC